MEPQTVRQCALIFAPGDLRVLGERLEAAFPDIYFMDSLTHSMEDGAEKPQLQLKRHLAECYWARVELLFGTPGPHWDYVRVPTGPYLQVWKLRDIGYPNGRIFRYGLYSRDTPDRRPSLADVMIGESSITVWAMRDQPEQVRKIAKVLRLAKKIAVTNKCRWYAFEGSQRYPKRDEDANDQWVGPEALAWLRAQPGRILSKSSAGHRPLALMPRDWVETPDYPWPGAVRK